MSMSLFQGGIAVAEEEEEDDDVEDSDSASVDFGDSSFTKVVINAFVKVWDLYCRSLPRSRVATSGPERSVCVVSLLRHFTTKSRFLCWAGV